MLIRKVPYYALPERSAFQAVCDGQFLQAPFLLAFDGLLSCREEGMLLTIPGAMDIRVSRGSYQKDAAYPSPEWARAWEGCYLFREQEELLLEADFHMCLPKGGKPETFSMRLPLSAPFLTDTLYLLFNGTWLRFLDGAGNVLNENSGKDRFCTPTGPLELHPAVQDLRVTSAKGMQQQYREQEEDTDLFFYSPYGWNTHAGDVMNFYHDGVYHLAYLVDRRHHGSRNCRGAHYILQLTSTDLVHWQEQVPVVELEAPWMSCGTGTMLFHQGKYYMSYGLHTERYDGPEPHITPPRDPETGAITPVHFREVLEAGGLPRGGTYAVSEDGIHFVNSEVLYHTGTNPSAYGHGEDGISVQADFATYRAKQFGAPFALVAEQQFRSRVMRNTAECPSHFEWNGYRYLLQGFTGYFRTTRPGSEDYADAALLGENIYDGLGVPMVTGYREGRKLMAGWLEGRSGWGSVVVHRELLQEEEGKLGMKWVPELLPNITGLAEADPEALVLPERGSFYLELEVLPGDCRKLALCFTDREGIACNLELHLDKKRAQFCDAEPGAFGKPIPTMYEQFLEADPAAVYFMQTDVVDIPRNSYNFSIPDIPAMDRPFTLRVLAKHLPKLRGTVMDVEIAGRRTMVSLRTDFYPTACRLLREGGDAQVRAKLGSI